MRIPTDPPFPADESALNKLGIHDHPCSIYETADELKRGFVPYMQAGLTLGERCIYFVDENSPTFVVEAMTANDFNLQPFIDNGAFQIISTADAHLRGGFFDEHKMLVYWSDALKQARQDGFASLRAAVEMTWALSGLPGCEILAPYEARLNNFTCQHPVSVICQYHRGKFSPDKIKAIIHAHPLVVLDDQVYNNPSCVPPEKFVEGDSHLDIQAILDNLALIKKLERTNKELAIKKRESDSLYEELQVLARTLSHELQEPLAIIGSYLRLLSVRYKGQLGEDADEFIDKTVVSAQVVARMIDDLWTYARVDIPSESRTQTVNSALALGKALEHLHGLIAETGAQISHDRLPEIVTCERHLVFLFQELIKNAIVHSGIREPQIHVSAGSKGSYICWSIKDNGKGLDEIHSNSVFRVFSRLQRKPDATGSGMGLAICKRIMEHHRGNIWFESDGKKGTTFCFTLPKDEDTIDPENVMRISTFIKQKAQRGHNHA